LSSAERWKAAATPMVLLLAVAFVALPADGTPCHCGRSRVQPALVLARLITLRNLPLPGRVAMLPLLGRRRRRLAALPNAARQGGGVTFLLCCWR